MAGPEQSQAGAWARLLAPCIDGAATMSARLRVHFVGGQDGVTGANQFEAWAPSPDQDALLLPGSAMLAWVAGDSRVRFDATRFIPLFASLSPGLLMVRQAASRKAGMVRVGCSFMLEPGLAGLLALDVLGVPAIPTRLQTDCLQAAREGLVDAVFLHGDDVLRQRHMAESFGLRPCFAISAGGNGGFREPWLADVATLAEALAARPLTNPVLLDAYHAVAAACTLDVLLTLPGLSLPSGVSRWRLACSQLDNSESLRQVAEARGLRFVTGPDSAASLRRAAVGGASQRALRQWLAARLDWRPT